jgi:transcriptional regulator with PAS, ATPase and Fis domain
MDKKTLELFEAYNWPGKIQELQNVIERTMIFGDSERRGEYAPS